MTDRGNVGRTPLFGAIAVGLTYTVFAGGTFFGIQTSTGRTFNLLLAGATLIPWLAASIVSEAWRPRTHLLPAIGASLGALVVSALTSTHPRISVDFVAYGFLLAGLYLLITRILVDGRLRAHLGALVVCLCATFCIAYLMQVGGSWISWWQDAVQGFAPPPLRPVYAGLGFNAPIPVGELAVGLGATAVAYLGWGTAVARLSSGLLIALVSSVALITASRGIWLGCAVGLAVVGVLIFWVRRSGSRAAFAAHRRTALIGIGALGIFVVVLSASVAARLSEAGGVELRSEFASVSYRMFQSSPITGIGPGTWPIERTAFTDAGQLDFWSPHAHSIYWQTLAEVGVIGALAGLLAILFAAWLIRGAFVRGSPRDQRMALAAVFLVTFILIEEAVGFSANLPALLIVFGIPFAWLDAATDSSAAPPLVRFGRPATLVALALVLGAVTSLASLEGPARQAEKAVRLLDLGSPQGAYGTAMDALRSDPDVPLYAFVAGLAGADIGRYLEARALLESSAAADGLAEAWVDAAYLSLRLGDGTSARVDTEKAERLGVQRAQVLIPAVMIWLGLGEPSRATSDLARALVAEPTLADDPHLASDPDYAPLLQNAVEEALATAPAPTRFEIALRQGRPLQVQASIGDLDPRYARVARLVVPAWTGDVNAIRSLQELARTNPLDTQIVGWCARVALHLGDESATLRYQAWLETIDPLSASQLAHVTRVVPGGQPAPLRAWTVSSAYGPALYRRPSPASLLIRDLPALRSE